MMERQVIYDEREVARVKQEYITKLGHSPEAVELEARSYCAKYVYREAPEENNNNA